jgi:membrane-bound lytic murein transglycosylase D
MKTTLWKCFASFTLLFASYTLKAAKLPLLNITPEETTGVKLLFSDSSLQELNLAVTKSEPDNRILLQPAVQKFASVYLKEHSILLEKLKQNNNTTLRIIENILRKHGIPGELKYLAVVESKLKNTATSGVGAAGVWQLMPVTARALGLKVYGKTDERRNIYNSTAAAADYLSTLYGMFDDWLLVVAAYNCGAGNVYKAINKAGSRDFWKLQYFLPLETRNHVKRFIATHYFFEDEGSFVTLTKKERLQHIALLSVPVEQMQDKKSSIQFDVNNCVNWITVECVDNRFVVTSRK